MKTQEILNRITEFNLEKVPSNLLYTAKYILSKELLINDEYRINHPMKIYKKARISLFNLDLYLNANEEEQNLIETALNLLTFECLEFNKYYELEE